MYPDESHDLANLEIESNIYLATSTSNSNQMANDEADVDQQHGTSTTQTVGNQITTITSSNNEQNISTTIQTIKIRLKSTDENENPKQNSKKMATVDPPPPPPPPPAPTSVQQEQLVEENNNLNDSHIDDDDVIVFHLSSTEEEVEKVDIVVEEPKQQHIPVVVPAIVNNKKMNAEKGKPVNNRKITTTKSNIYRTQFNVDQLKSGLTVKSDVTFIQLYLALNKPTVIKLKYEWHSIKPLYTIPAADCGTVASVDADSAQAITNVELIDNQRFYLQVLARVAESYLSEMKTQSSEYSNDARTATSSSTSNKKSIEKTNDKVLQASSKSKTSNNEGTTTTASAVAISETNKTQKLFQDMSSKARKLRQRKAIVVKSTRVATRDSCESPTPAIMSPCSIITTSSSSSSTAPVTTSNSNIVVSAPVAAVARQIVNTSNDNHYSVTTQRKKLTNSINQQPTQQAKINQFSNNLLIGYQDQHQQQLYSMQQNYSNIIPQIMTTFLSDNNNNSADSDNYGTNGGSNNYSDSGNISLNDVILHSNLILSDDQTLIPNMNPIHNEHQQQQQIVSNSNCIDLSLIDISLNNDSVFCLNENSNMSSLSSKFHSV